MAAAGQASVPPQPWQERRLAVTAQKGQHEVGPLPGLDAARVLLPSPWDALLSLSGPSFLFPRP